MVDIFETKEACTSYLMWNAHHEGFIVDPGYNERNCLINHIKKMGVDIKAILLTHAHYDHIGALEDVCKAFPNALCYIHKNDVDLLTDPHKNLSFFTKELDFMPTNLHELEDEETFVVADFQIKVLHTPFHTHGSCCYYLAKENILFSGDTLFYSSIGRTDLPTGSNRTINSSLTKLLKLPDETLVYPGHGSKTTLGREKNYNSYLKI